MQYLVGTDSIHTTAAICDYLEERASGDDAVTVVAVAPPDDPTTRRDCEEALNVAPIRLAAVGEVETEVRTGGPVAELRDAAAESSADELVVGAHGGDPEATRELGSTTQGLLADAERPVVVVPIPDL